MLELKPIEHKFHIRIIAGDAGSMESHSMLHKRFLWFLLIYGSRGWFSIVCNTKSEYLIQAVSSTITGDRFVFLIIFIFLLSLCELLWLKIACSIISGIFFQSSFF